MLCEENCYSSHTALVMAKHGSYLILQWDNNLHLLQHHAAICIPVSSCKINQVIIYLRFVLNLIPMLIFVLCSLFEGLCGTKLRISGNKVLIIAKAHVCGFYPDCCSICVLDGWCQLCRLVVGSRFYFQLGIIFLYMLTTVNRHQDSMQQAFLALIMQL